MRLLARIAVGAASACAAAAPMAAHAATASDLFYERTVMVAADGRGNGYTLAAGARSAQRDTRRSKAERRSGVSGRK